jgi:hypothetical protein
MSDQRGRAHGIHVEGAWLKDAEGFDAHATGARLAWDAARQHLRWEASPGETAHLLVLTPRGAGLPSAWPEGLWGEPPALSLHASFP